MSSSPQIIRPKPRRPFEQSTASNNGPPSPLLSPADAGGGNSETPSRTHSILNLTSSTLFGIYSPTGYGDRSDDPPTPWGTGAESPLTLSPSSSSLAAGSLRVRRRSVAPQFTPYQKPNPWADAARLGSRIILLFVIGVGYGSLVRHLHDDRQLAPFQVEGIIKPRNDWRYLIFWGVAGVLLGSLLPWVDGFFESEAEETGVTEEGANAEEKESSNGDEVLGSDWTPVIRSVGAFVGIAFAIRKLPWASTLQASLTLALVNPVLWYLIDRSMPGFILSTGVGLTGTALLLVSNPDMMPSPASGSLRNSSIEHTHILGDFEGWGMSAAISRESIEGAIWIWSVLFCSCVCFGNIGRRLALSNGRKEKAFASRITGQGASEGTR